MLGSEHLSQTTPHRRRWGRWGVTAACATQAGAPAPPSQDWNPAAENINELLSRVNTSAVFRMGDPGGVRVRPHLKSGAPFWGVTGLMVTERDATSRSAGQVALKTGSSWRAGTVPGTQPETRAGLCKYWLDEQIGASTNRASFPTKERALHLHGY